MPDKQKDEAEVLSFAKAPPNARADVVMGIGVAVCAVVLYYLTQTWKPSAAIFPRVVALFMFGLGVANAWQGYRRLNTEPQTPFLPDPIGLLKIWIAIPSYFVGIWLVGFPVSTIVLTVALAATFGYRRYHLSLLAGVIFVAAMLLVFTGLFDRPLPNGVLFAPLIN